MSDNILRALTSAGEDFDVEQHASKILQSCNFVDVSKYVEELTLAEQDLDKNLGEKWQLDVLLAPPLLEHLQHQFVIVL